MVDAIWDIQVISAFQNCENVIKGSSQFIPDLEIAIKGVTQIQQPVVDVPVKPGGNPHHIGLELSALTIALSTTSSSSLSPETAGRGKFMVYPFPFPSPVSWDSPVHG